MAEVLTRVTANDRRDVAEYVVREFRRRAEENPDRKELDKQIKDIDRQLRMEPKKQRQKEPQDMSEAEAARAWMASVEVSDQAEAYEIILSDVRRTLFSAQDEWFSSHVVLTDDYARKMEGESLIAGTDIESGGLNQDTANLIVQSVLHQFHRSYDFRRHWDLAIGEAIKYSMGMGRIALVHPPKHIAEYRGLKSSQKIPMFFPVSIKNCWPDDSSQSVLHEGLAIAPSTIRRRFQRLADIKLAARSGEGWIKSEIDQLTESSHDRADKEVLEMEGDFYISRSRNDFWLENHIATVVRNDGPRLIRLRKSSLPFRSYLPIHYQQTDVERLYGSSPCLQGRPIQIAASEALNRALNAAALNSDPHLLWKSGDQQLQAKGGIDLMPGGQSEVDRIENVKSIEVGDPTPIFAMYTTLRNIFRSHASTDEPRTGSLKSHTTAEGAAIADARSVLRTVDFADGVAKGPLATFLYMEFVLAKEALRNPLTAFVPSMGSHLEVAAKHWPDEANFTVRGAGGALEKQREISNFMTAIQTAAQVEAQALKQGGAPLNWPEIQQAVFEMFEVQDAQRFTGSPEGVSSQAQGGPGIPADIGEGGDILAQIG